MEENKAIIHPFYDEVINRRHLAVQDGILAPDDEVVSLEEQVIVDVVTHVSQTHAIHEMALMVGGSMFQEDEYAQSSTLATPGSYSLSTSSRRATITATIIREEAAESLLPDIQEDAELAALAQVLNRYKAQWWLKHLRSVGADPVMYWRAQLGEEIQAATSGKNSPSQGKKFPWWFFRSFAVRVKYTIVDLHLDPL